jgi:hypothetical protein
MVRYGAVRCGAGRGGAGRGGAVLSDGSVRGGVSVCMCLRWRWVGWVAGGGGNFEKMDALLGVFHHRCTVAGDKRLELVGQTRVPVFDLAYPHDQGAPPPAGHHLARVVPALEQQGRGPLQLTQHLHHQLRDSCPSGLI